MNHAERTSRTIRQLLAAAVACALLAVTASACDRTGGLTSGQRSGQAGGHTTGGQASAARPAQQAAPAASPTLVPAPSGVTPSASPSPRPQDQPLAGDVVAIDPGHNGGNAAHPDIVNQLVNVITEQKPCDTTGTETDAGYPEHAFSFDVASRLAAILRKQGARVVLTRDNDTGTGPCITQRAAIGNRAHADAAISIHADGGPPGGTGFEVIEPGLVPGYTDKIIAPSRRLGLDIRAAYHTNTGEPYSDYLGTDGLDVRTDLGGLNLSAVPKVFIECANMRNSADAARLTSAAFRQRVAAALAAGLVAFLHGQ